MKDPIPKWMADEVAAYDLDLTPAPRTILDIGANIGAFSLHYSAKWPEAMITAFEPVKKNFVRLTENVAGNDRIRKDFRAVRATGGQQKIFLGDRDVTCGFHQLGRQTDNTETVNCIAARAVVSCELVKIDTEGCEVEILSELDLHLTRALVVEYHSQKDKGVICGLLDVKGFDLIDHKPGSTDHGVLKFGRPSSGVTIPKPRRRIYFAVAGHFAANDLLFVQSLLRMAIGPKISVAFGWSCDPSVERARNILTANFLESDCTHILFVDSDVGFSPEDVARIGSHDEPVVGGIYPLKNMNPEVQWCGNGLPSSGAPDARPDGLMPVKYIGTGFLCIARSVFEKIIEHEEGAISYRQDFAPHRREHAFWMQGVRKDRFLTEDWYFCDRWLDMGGRIFADTRVILKHAGRAEWPLPFQKGNPFITNSEPKTAEPKA